ncbi:hypothetical protein WR25_15033 [Diploscapter pachys]|uniref:sphinganine-1-phosphate aldolase n=1 Tax=Diploscapter pachys TaxID=2018661 RepID=A0A2A2LJN0_9BILA|nr:hypothetical protein WR25_15033 [Diploscapter pachys]
MDSRSHSTYRVVFEQIDLVRRQFNRQTSHLEAWQIVSYTVSVCFLIAYIRRITRSDKPVLVQLRLWFFKILRSLPWVKRRIKADLERARQEIEEEVHQMDTQRDFYRFLPERPIEEDDLVAEARSYAQMGVRKYMEHYDPQTREQDLKVCARIFDLFSHTDPHRSDAFPGVRKMEAEVLRMCCSLFHGGPESGGVVASGGTEALLLACIGNTLSYRNLSRVHGDFKPEIIAPVTAHAALAKAAAFFDMRIIRVPVKADDRADVGAIKRAIGPHTCLIFASACNHITGTVDPIEKIANLAHKYSIPFHVDCTLGGFLLPFLEYCDINVPAFDFRLPGVSSISVDLHRYGQCPRSCSVLMYRNAFMLRYQCFRNNNWVGGTYSTPTMAGGRDGGAVATAWGTLLRKGRDGYINACSRVVEGTKYLAEKLLEIQGITIRGSADLCVVAFSTDNVDIYALVEQMVGKNWHVDALLSPVAARVPVTLSFCESGIVDKFVREVRETIADLQEKEALTKQSKLSAYYHMLQKMSDKSLVDELSLIRIHAHYSIPPPIERKSIRTISVEGRKISMIHSADQQLKIIQEIRRRQNNDDMESVESEES